LLVHNEAVEPGQIRDPPLRRHSFVAMTRRAVHGDELSAMYVTTQGLVDGGFIPRNVGWNPERRLRTGHNFLMVVKPERILNSAWRRRRTMPLMKARQDQKPDPEGDDDNS
jgi:hypothetical protein